MEIQLTDWQEEICFHPARFAICDGGRRVGKSTLAMARIKLRCLPNPGFHALYIAPYHSQADEIFEMMIGDEELQPYIKRTKTRPNRMWFNTGSRCDWHSFQRSESIRGKGIDDLITDESQSVDENDWWRVARPLLSDKRGSVLLLGQSRLDWRHRQFFAPGQAEPGSEANPLDDGVPRYKSWRIPSSLGPAFQSDEGKRELEIARQQMSKWQFESEYECKIGVSPEAAFNPDNIHAITKGEILKAPARQSDAFIVGHDVGKVRDPSASVVMHADTGAVVHVERYPQGMSHEQQARRCAQISTMWNNALVVLDATGGGGGGHKDGIIEIYRSLIRNIRTQFLNPYNKEMVCLRLCLEIEQRRISIPAACSDLLRELGGYEAHFKNGHWTFFGPGGHGDDIVIALALAVWGRAQNWVIRPGARTNLSAAWQ